MSVNSKKEYLAQLYAAQKKRNDDFAGRVSRIRERQAQAMGTPAGNTAGDSLAGDFSSVQKDVLTAVDNAKGQQSGQAALAAPQGVSTYGKVLGDNAKSSAPATDARAVYQTKGTEPDVIKTSAEQSAVNRALAPQSVAAKSEALRSDLANRLAVPAVGGEGAKAAQSDVVLPGVTRPYTEEEQLSADIDKLKAEKQQYAAKRIGSRYTYEEEIGKLQEQIDEKQAALDTLQGKNPKASDTVSDNRYTRSREESKEKLADRSSYVLERGLEGVRSAVENIGTTLGSAGKSALATAKSGAGTKPVAKSYKDAMETGLETSGSAVGAAYNRLTDEMIANVAAMSKSGEQKKRLADLEEKYSDADINAVTRVLGDIAQSAGYSLPADVAGLIVGPAGTAVVMGTAAFSDALSDAIEKGYSREDAIFYATQETLNQAAMETLFDIAGGGLAEGKIMDALDQIPSALGKTAAKIGVTGVGEGVEEVAQSLITTLNQRMAGDKEASVDLSELGYEFLVGSLSGALRGAPVQAVQAAREARVNTPTGAINTPTADGNTPTEVVNTPTEDVNTPTETAELKQDAVISEDTAKPVAISEEDVIKTDNVDEGSVEGFDEETEVHEETDADSPLERALDTAKVDLYTAGNEYLAAYDGNTKAAVDALYAEGNRLVKDGSSEAKARLETVEALRDNIVKNGVVRVSENAGHLKKVLKDYGVKNVLVDMKLAGSGSRGYYEPVTKSIVLSPTLSGTEAVNFVAAHELFHHAAAADTTLVNDVYSLRDALSEKGLIDSAKIVKERYMAAYADVAYEHARSAGGQAELKAHMDAGMTRSDAIGKIVDDYIRQEMAADILGELVQNPEVMKKLSREDRTLWERIVDALRNFVAKVAGKGETLAQQRLMDTIRGILKETSGTSMGRTEIRDGVAYNEAGEAVSYQTKNGSVRLSIATYEDGGRDTLAQYMDAKVASGELSASDRDDILSSMDEIYGLCKNMTGEYKPFGEWSEAVVEVDENGDPVFSVVKPNGEYAMNLDFSLVCKKRRALDAVFNEMIRRGVISDFDLGQDKIVRINDIIREHGFETACTFCFVDSKRFRQAKVADDFVKMYNGLVRSMANGGEIGYFNFGGDETLPAVEGGIDTMADDALDFTKLDKVLAGGKSKTVPYKIAQHLKDHPEDRKLFSRGDFMSSGGFEAVKKQNPAVLSLYNSKKGSGGPKASFGDVQYLSDVIKDSKFKASAAYDVGGVRVQSFSDYVARLVFDYVQMIGDLAAKGLPAHAYTKEILFVKQFGLTGMKINMSLAPAVGDGRYAGLNADGSYAFAAESFDFETAKAIQNDPEYGKNCGTIAIGVSDEHIWKLLSDPDIRMVIPYHKSGLNPVVAKMNNISQFSDYTKTQNTRYKDGKKLSEADMKNHPNFNRMMQDGMNAVEAARAYVQWCEDNGYLPKFDKFAYNADGTFNENYYKLLEDFTTMVDGQYHPQGPVKAVFPTADSAFGSMESLIREGLDADAVTQARQDNEVVDIVDEIEEMLGGAGEGVRYSRDVGDVRWSESKTFNEEIASWEKEGRNSETVLEVGMTGDVLQGLGTLENDIYILGDKINKILEKHPEITLDEIRKIPQILNNPVLVLKSSGKKTAGQNTRLVIFGSVKAKNGQPVLSVLDIRPVEDKLVIDDMQKVTSVYTKGNNPVEFIRNSDVLYAEKKISTRLLRTIGFQMPIELHDSGYVGSISYDNQNVNIEGKKFSEVFSEGNAGQDTADHGYVDATEFENAGTDARESRDVYTEEEKLEFKLQQQRRFIQRQYTAETAFGSAVAASPAQRKSFATEVAHGLPGVTIETVERAISPVWDVFEEAKRGSDDTVQSRVDEAYKLAREAAQGLIDGVTAKRANPLYEQYADLRKKLRTTPIKNNISVKEFGGTEDYAKWRNGNRGLLRISGSADAIGVDVLYSELCETYPEFFSAEVINPADMLKRLGEVAVELKKTASTGKVDYDPLEGYRERAVEELADRIMIGFNERAVMTLEAKRKQEGDKAKARAKESEEAYRMQAAEHKRQVSSIVRDYNTSLNRLVKEVDRQSQKIDRMTQTLSGRSSNLLHAAEKKRFLANLNRLYTMLTEPNKKKHIPEAMKRDVAELLGQFGGTVLTDTKFVDAKLLQSIVNSVPDMQIENGDIRVEDPFIASLKADLRVLDGIREAIAAEEQNPNTATETLVRMGTDYMRSANNVLKKLSGYITTQNQLFIDGKIMEADVFASELISDLSGRRRYREWSSDSTFGGEYTNAKRAIADKMHYEAMSAGLFFEMIGESGVQLDRTFRAGQNKQVAHEEEFVQYMRRRTKGKYSTFKAGGYGGNRITVNLGDGSVDVSKAQLMSLYLLWKRPAARRHLEAQGAVFADANGKEHENRTFQITKEVMEQLTKHLSDEDLMVADAMQSFLARQCSDWGNEAAMQMYGFRMYEDPDYFPIRVSETVKMRNAPAWGAQLGDISLENSGFTKRVDKNSRAAIVIDNVFDVTENHVKRMASYNAYAPICNDMQRVLSRSEVRGAIKRGLGNSGMRYIDNFLKNVNDNKVSQKEGSGMYGWMNFLGNMSKRAAVAFNMSTVAKQPLSIVRVFNEMDPQYILKAMATKGFDARFWQTAEYKRLYDTMVENSGVAKMKMLGYSDTGFSKSMRQQWDDSYVNTDGALRSVMTAGKATRALTQAYDWLSDLGMKGAAWADEGTWVAIWKACELESADKYAHLSEDERLAKTTERFGEIVGRTQVVDSVLDTAPFKDNLVGSGLGAFMNEPVKQYAELVVAVDALKNSGKGTAKRAKAAKKFAVVMTTALASNLILEPIVSAIFSGLRDEEDDSDQAMRKFLRNYLGIDLTEDSEGVKATDIAASQFVDGIVGLVPAVGEIYGLIVDALAGYDNTRFETDGLQNVVKSVAALFTGGGSKTDVKKVDELLSALGLVTGVPYKTLSRDIRAICRDVFYATDNHLAAWNMNKVYYNLGDSSARSGKYFYDILAHAYKEGDAEAYAVMRKELAEIPMSSSFGVSQDTITTNIEKRGGTVEVGSQLWYIDLQAAFHLETFNKDMKAEKLITDVYRLTGANSVLPKAPSNSFTVAGETVKIDDPVRYQAFAEEVGEFSYMVLVNMSSAKGYGALTDEQKQAAIEKAYDYARKRGRKNLYSDYNMANNLFGELYGKNATPSAVAGAILTEVQKKK